MHGVEAHIGQQIRKRRHFLGMSQTDLANKIGVTFQQIQKYEKGQNKIMASRLLELSKIMDTSINYFFENVNEDSNVTHQSLNDEAAKFVYQPPEENSANTMKLVKIYNKIGSNDTKKKLLVFLKALSKEEEEKNDHL